MLWKLLILIVSIILCILYDYIKDKNKKLANLILCIIVVFFSIIFAYREYFVEANSIGTDYYEYKHWFEIKSFSNLFLDKSNFLFNVLISVTKIFTPNFHIFLFFCALITNGCIFDFIKNNSINLRIPVIIYICLFFSSTFNVMRQWIACSIFLYSFKHIKNKNIIKYLICVIIASLFHNTALFLIIIYPLLNSKINIKKKLQLIISIGIVLILSYQYIINILYEISNLLGFDYVTKYQNYSGSTGNYTNFIISTLTLILLLINFKKIKTIIKKRDYIEEYTIYLSLYSIVSFLSTKSYIFNRINLYFVGSLFVTFPLLLKLFNNKSSILIEYGIFILLGFVFIT